MHNQPDGFELPRISMGMEICRTEHMIRRRMCQMENEPGMKALTGGQGMILGYIQHCHKKEIFQKDIEQTFNIRRSTATVALQKIEQAGFIRRVAVQSDARLKKIEITPAGREAAQCMENTIAAMETGISRGITPQEQQQFLHILHKINDNLGGGSCREK